MAKKKPMDKLSQDAAKALACNMSYGKWKAMQEPTPIAPKAIPEGWAVCKRCGRVFKPTIKRPQKYCDIICQTQAYYYNNQEKLKEYNADYKKKRKEREHNERE